MGQGPLDPGGLLSSHIKERIRHRPKSLQKKMTEPGFESNTQFVRPMPLPIKSILLGLCLGHLLNTYQNRGYLKGEATNGTRKQRNNVFYTAGIRYLGKNKQSLSFFFF